MTDFIMGHPVRIYRDWDDLVKAQSKPTPMEWLELFFTPWSTALAPIGTVGVVYDCNRPLYRYKSINSKVFYLQPRCK